MCLYLVGDTLNFGAASREAQEDPAVAESLGRAFENSAQWILRWPMKKGLNPLTPSPDNEKWLLDNMQHTDYDGFWKLVLLLQPVEYLDKYADVPGYYVGSWYDTYQEDLLYAALRQRKSRPLRLLMGPWTHMNFERTSGDVDFGADAGLTKEQYRELQLGWFDETLKGVDSGALKEPPVKIFVMGGGSGKKTAEGKMVSWWQVALRERVAYRADQANPLLFSLRRDPGSGEECTGRVVDHLRVPSKGSGAHHRLHLLLHEEKSPNRRLVTQRGDGCLGNAARAVRAIRGLRPEGGSARYFGCKTDLPLASRHDVIVFQTPPLATDVEVTGPIAVKLWASSSAVDTDFTAKLVDVHPRNIDYPDGYAMGLTNSILRASYRNGFERRELMEPGTPILDYDRVAGREQPLQEGPQDQDRYLEQQLPRFRREPEHGGPIHTGREDQGRREYHLSQPRTGISRPPSGRS